MKAFSIMDTVEWKFFDRDIIGRKPRKIGSKFKAEVFGQIRSFKVTYMIEGVEGKTYIAVLVPGVGG